MAFEELKKAESLDDRERGLDAADQAMISQRSAAVRATA